MPACFNNEILIERIPSTPRKLWETASDMPFVDPSFFDMIILPKNWKILIFHTGFFRRLSQTMWKMVCERHARFFSALNPQVPDQEEVDSSEHSSNQLRKFLYKHCRRLHSSWFLPLQIEDLRSSRSLLKTRAAATQLVKMGTCWLFVRKKGPTLQESRRELHGEPARPLEMKTLTSRNA